MFGTFALANVLNTPHDLSVGSTSTTDVSNTDQICVFCHSPHGNVVGFRPLWNHDANSGLTQFQVYGNAADPNQSATMDSIPVNFAANANSTSAFCLGCHDGVSAVNALSNDPNDIVGPLTLGNGTEFDADGSLLGVYPANPKILGTAANFLNEHPINMTPPLPATDPGMAAIVANEIGATPLPLYVSGAQTDTVQCGSCHNPHDNTNTAFLRMSMVNSALCSNCHINK
jgi:predicted CXXCH cytochrome family protein